MFIHNRNIFRNFVFGIYPLDGTGCITLSYYVAANQYKTDNSNVGFFRPLHTQVYGDPKILSQLKKAMLDRKALYWYPLRVRNSTPPRLMTMKERLDHEEKVSETYIPMEYRTEKNRTRLVPAINNIIFVRSTYNDLVEIRSNLELYEPLRYIMHPVTEKRATHYEALYVPDTMMQDFIRVTAERQDNVIFLDNLDFAFKPGIRAQITDGPYTGVTGIVKHIKKSLCVIIPIEGVAAVGIMHVPRHHLRYIAEKKEVEQTTN